MGLQALGQLLRSELSSRAAVRWRSLRVRLRVARQQGGRGAVEGAESPGKHFMSIL